MKSFRAQPPPTTVVKDRSLDKLVGRGRPGTRHSSASPTHSLDQALQTMRGSLCIQCRRADREGQRVRSKAGSEGHRLPDGAQRPSEPHRAGLENHRCSKETRADDIGQVSGQIRTPRPPRHRVEQVDGAKKCVPSPRSPNREHLLSPDFRPSRTRGR